MALLILLASAGAAQYHNLGYVAGGSYLHLALPTGKIVTLYDNPGTSYGVTMAADNKTIWFGEGTTKGLFRYDPQALAVTTIIVDTLALYYPRDMVINQDGDLVVATQTRINSVSQYALVKYSTGVLTTMVMAPATTMAWYGGLEVDIDTGDYVVQDRSTPDPLLAVTPSGAIKTLATGFNARYSLTQDIRTGDWYSSYFTDFYRLKKGGATPTLFGAIGTTKYYYALACDRASAAKPRIVSQYSTGLYFTDLATRTVTSVTMAFSGSTKYELEFYRGRNLCSVRAGAGQWALRLSFPLEGGKAYAVGLSITGVRPGVKLADGRMINLAPDPITFATLGNLIPGIFKPGPGVLDRSGEAQAVLDVSSLPRLNGLRVYVEALVLDSAAPTGIGTIADPIGINLP